MMAQIVRVVLNADRDSDRRILDYLFYAGKPMSKLFKMAMHEFIDRQDGAGEEEKMLADIRRVIREELQNVKISGPAESFSQPVNEDDEAPAVSPFDFLDALAQMDSF